MMIEPVSSALSSAAAKTQLLTTTSLPASLGGVVFADTPAQIRNLLAELQEEALNPSSALSPTQIQSDLVQLQLAQQVQARLLAPQGTWLDSKA